MAWTPPSDAVEATATPANKPWAPPSDAIEATGDTGPTGLSALLPSAMRGFRGLASLGGDVIPAMAARAVGKNKYAEEQLQEAAAYGKETEKLYPAAVGSYTNVKDIGTGITYAVEAVGEAIPTLLPSLFTGGAAAIAGRGAVAAAKLAAEKAAVAQVAKGATAEAVKDAAMKAGVAAANKVALKYQAAGALTGSAAQNIPDVFQNIYEKTGKMDLGAAIVAGGFNAALDAVTPVMLLRKANLSGISPQEIAAAWYKRAGKGAAKGFVTEGGTEAIQEMSSAAAEKFVDSNLDFFTAKNFERFIDAGLKGGIGGGAITGATDVALGKGPEKKGPPPKGFVPPKDAILTPAAPATPLAPKQQARQDAVAKRAQELEEQSGITYDDAIRIAEDDIAAEEEKIRGLTTKAPDTRVKTRAVELIDAGVNPDEAYATATQQIQDELEADAQNKEEGALDVAGTKPKRNRKSTGVASQPVAGAPAAGVETTERAGMVPTGEDVGVPAVGEEQGAGALTETPATAPTQFTTFTPIKTETQEGAPPSVTTPIETKQTKPKKQKAAATTVAPEVPKVDIAAANAATDPVEIQQHLDAIEVEGASLLSADGRFPKKGTPKRIRLDEIGAVKRALVPKLQPPKTDTEVVAPVVAAEDTVASVEEAKTEETTAPVDEAKTEETTAPVDEAKTEETTAPVDEAKTEETTAPVEEAKTEEAKTEEAKTETKEPESWYSFVDSAREQAERELAGGAKGVEDVSQYEGYTPGAFPQATGPSQALPAIQAAEAEEMRKRKAPSAREEEAAAKAKEKAERASKEEQQQAEAAGRPGAVDLVSRSLEIVGALNEIIRSKLFPVGVKNDAQKYLKEIIRASNAKEDPEGSLEPAFNFLVEQASKPRFMRTGVQSLPSIGKDRVQAIVNRISARWKNAPTVVVAENIDDSVVPEALRKANADAIANGAEGVPAGVFYDGKVYIFADQIKSSDDAARVLLHESLGHYGLRGTFGAELDPILDLVAKNHKGEVAAIAKKYGLDLNDEAQLREAAEEVLANLAQTKPTMGVVQRAIAAVRRFLRRIGFDVKLSNADLIANYILPARAFVENERIARAVGGAPAFSRTEEENLPPEEKKLYTDTVRTQAEIDKAVAKAKFNFSESAKAQEAAKGVSALQLATDPAKSIPALRSIWKRATMLQRKYLAKLVPTSFLVNWAGDAIPELSNTNKLLQKMGGMTEQLLHSAGELTKEVERAFRADETLRGKLDNLTSVATLVGVDPAVIDTAERNDELDKAWKGLGADGQKVYLRIRNHFEVLSKYLSKLLDDQVDSLNISDEDKKNLMKKIRATFEKGSRINPYFPLVREGDFWLAMGSGDNRVFFMAETATERDNAAREFAADKLKRGASESESAFEKRVDDKLAELTEDGEFEMGDTIGDLRRKPYGQGQGKMLTGTFEAIDGIDFADPEARERLKDAIYQTFLETMPDQSFRQQFIHRKGTAGFRVDVLRNTAHTSARMATQLARVKYSPLLRNSLMSAKASIRGRTALDPFVAEMGARVDSELAPKNKTTGTEIAGALNKMAFIYYLGGASSALLQPLSIFQTGMPVLAQYGTFKATREMGRMLKVWTQFGSYKTNLDGSKSWVAPSILHAKDTTAVERKAYRAAAEMGLFASTQAAAVFESKATPTEKIRSPQMKLATGAVDALVMGGLMNSSERLAREAMFLTSFRLNMEQHGNFDKAVTRATYDTNEALGNYGQSERPVFMKQSFGKVLTQFQMYPLHVATFLINNFKEMIKPMNGRTRGEAAHKFFGTMGSTFVLAGAAGLPMFGTVMGLMGAAWNQMKDDDWPEDMKSMDFGAWFTEVGFAEWLGPAEIGGRPLSEILLRGLANWGTGADVASRTGLSNLFTRDSKEYKTVRESLMAKILDHAGPSANMVLSVVDGVDAAMQGDYAKAVKKWSPAGFRNFVSAHELATEGAKDNKGTVILSTDAFTTGMLIARAIGFQPEILANVQYASFKVLGAQQKVRNEHDLIIDKLDRAFRNENDKAFEATLDEIDKFNKKYPQNAILADEIMNSLEKRAEQRAISNRGVIPTEKNMFLDEVLQRSRAAADKAERENKRP